MALSVPADLTAFHRQFYGDDAALAWAASAPATVEGLLAGWSLTLDGTPTHGAVGWILPVRDRAGIPAVLKVQPQDDETRGEATALRLWGGEGAVRLLDVDPASGSLLLERLAAGTSLAERPVRDALTVIGGLLARLHPAPTEPGTSPRAGSLRTMADAGARWLDRAGSLGDRVPADLRPVLDACAGALAEVLPAPGDRVLHGDLHYTNVLAPLPGSQRRGAWLAIDPKPVVGHPGFELLPSLHNRWGEPATSGGLAQEVRYRFDLLTETAGIDRDLARAWTLARVLDNLLWALESGNPGWLAEDRVVAEALA